MKHFDFQIILKVTFTIITKNNTTHKTLLITKKYDPPIKIGRVVIYCVEHNKSKLSNNQCKQYTSIKI